jgi:hypothetical protein
VSILELPGAPSTAQVAEDTGSRNRIKMVEQEKAAN